MLTYLLALIVGLSSFGLYMAAFFFPEVHRKNDFIWSGLGLFYALVLWICAGRITGGVLLGQTASVALLSWLGWQTLTLRRQVVPADQQTAVPIRAALLAAVSSAWAGFSRSELIAPVAKPIGKQFAKLIAWVEALVTTTAQSTKPLPPKVEAQSYVPLTPADFARAKREAEQDSEAIAADVTLVQTGSKPLPQENVTQENSLMAIVKQVQGLFKGLATKPESKPVYVRKQFRAPKTESQTAAVEVSEVEPNSKHSPEPTPPEPPTLEQVEATIADVESTAEPTLPPITIEAESLPDAEPPQSSRS